MENNEQAVNPASGPETPRPLPNLTQETRRTSDGVPPAATPEAAPAGAETAEGISWPAETLLEPSLGEPAEPVAVEIQRVRLTPLEDAPGAPTISGIECLKDVHLEAGVELGQTTLTVERILNLKVGSVIELSQNVGEPVRLLINNNPYALGEVVVIGERFGIRISHLLHVPQAS